MKWCNSNYNTDGFIVSGSYIYTSDGRASIVDAGEGHVYIYDEIVEDTKFFTYYDE